MEEYDVVVIGSGSGLDVANGAVNHNLEVAIVEKGPLGGTCLNRGCIPSKMLIHRADLVESIRNSEKFGVSSKIENIDFPSIIKEVNEEVGNESDSIEKGIRNFDDFTLYKDEARFIDERTLEVSGNEIRGEKVIIAAGARPLIPPIKGLDKVDYLTSEDALSLEEQPEELVVVGGGYIGAELGHFYSSLGSDVKVIAAHENMLNREDKDISKKFSEIFGDKNDLYLGYRAEEVEKKEDKVTVIARNPKDERVEVSGDKLLLSTGRKPNTDILDVEKANVKTDDKGFIQTNQYLKTSSDNTWALGDIIGSPMFKHTANLESQYVFINAFTQHKHKIKYNAIPHVIFSSPQVAGVGSIEKELKDKGRDYVKGRYDYKNTGMGSALKENNGFVKALVDAKSGEILGCHVLGPHASILIHEVVVAMNSDQGTVDNVTGSVHAHPALNEVVQRAFNSLE